MVLGLSFLTRFPLGTRVYITHGHELRF